MRRAANEQHRFGRARGASRARDTRAGSRTAAGGAHSRSGRQAGGAQHERPEDRDGGKGLGQLQGGMARHLRRSRQGQRHRLLDAGGRDSPTRRTRHAARCLRQRLPPGRDRRAHLLRRDDRQRLHRREGRVRRPERRCAFRRADAQHELVGVGRCLREDDAAAGRHDRYPGLRRVHLTATRRAARGPPTGTAGRCSQASTRARRSPAH